jgi:creatinine amidohydrolase
MSKSCFKPFLELNGDEFSRNKFDKAILPVGSTEYHGEHLPFGTDTLVAEHLTKEICKNFKDLLMLPTIPIGMSAHYSSFPLAISLKTETLIQLLTEIFDSLNKHGLKKLIIINGHDGNIPAIDAATREYRTKHQDFKILVLEAWWVAAGQLVPENTFEVWGGLGHGGEGETSMMLKINPNLVNMKKARGVVPELPSYLEWKWTFNEITPYGVTGDPTKATVEKGKRMENALVKHTVEIIKKMEQNNWSI